MLTISDSFVLISKSVNQDLIDEMIHITPDCEVVRDSVRMPSLSKAESYDLKKKKKIVGIGGGTIIDTVKLIGYTHRLPVLVVPTVPGTGSEVTGFAVSYKDDGTKESVTTPIPDSVIMPRMAIELPDEVLFSSYFDTFAQCIESAWSKGRTAESISYAAAGLRGILEAYKYFRDNRMKSLFLAYRAAHLSGMAINISKTTAPHAMSYYLTSHHGFSHGKAVAATFGLWYRLCKGYLPEEVGCLIDEETVDILVDALINEEDLKDVNITEWVYSVNKERMSNSPVEFDAEKLINAIKMVCHHDSTHLPFYSRTN